MIAALGKVFVPHTGDRGSVGWHERYKVIQKNLSVPEYIEITKDPGKLGLKRLQVSADKALRCGISGKLSI